MESQTDKPKSMKKETSSSSNRNKIKFESTEDISNFYLKKTAFQLNDILKCVEDTHSRYECKEQIESLSKNLYEYRSEVSKFAEKSMLLGSPSHLLFPPQILSPPTIVYREYRGGSDSEILRARMRSFGDNRPEVVQQSPYSNHHDGTSISNMFQTVADGAIKFGSSLVRKIIGRGED